MRERAAGRSRVIRNRKHKFRRSFHNLSNRIKHNGFHKMNAGSNRGKSVHSSDIICLIDDKDIENQSLCDRSENVPRVSSEGRVVKKGRRGLTYSLRLNQSFASNVIVDLSVDQGQQETRAPKVCTGKCESIAVSNDYEDIALTKKIKGDIPATVVSNASNQAKKILGFDCGGRLPKNDTNEIVVLSQDEDEVECQTICVQKSEEKPTSSLGTAQDRATTSEEHTTTVQKQLELNDSVIILDSDDDSPTSECNFIPLKRKRLSSPVKVLRHILKVPQRKEVAVIKHITPPQVGPMEIIDSTVIIEDRCGSSEKFCNSNFWKNPVKAGERRKKSHAGSTSSAVQQSLPVKQLDDSNIFNPTPVSSNSGLRPVIIDGSNVAWGHGNHNYFSAVGLEICINYFSQRKHRVIAFVPHYQKTKKVPGLIEMLEKYERLGQVVITPSRKIDGKMVSSYEDRYIVQAATELGGVIVSTDNYRDIMVENPRWKETIEKRLLMFTWVGDMLMFPQDPLGRNGPTLEEFLRFPD